MLNLEEISFNIVTSPMWVYIGEINHDTSHDVPMHRTGTKWVEMVQHKIVHHYDIGLLPELCITFHLHCISFALHLHYI